MRQRRESAILFGCLLALALLVVGLAHARDVEVNPPDNGQATELLMDGAGWYGLGIAELSPSPDLAPTHYSPAAHCGLGYGLQQQTQLH